MKDLNVINSKTKLFGIFGNPVEHSLSPVIHNHCFQNNNINAVYLAFKVTDIKRAIESIRDLNMKGVSITIPHKIDAMNYCDEIDPLAQEIGSINTIINTEGKLKGYNTDGYGAYLSLINEDITIKNKKILILGNGGSARAIAFTLKNEGGFPIICGRNAEKAQALAHDMGTKDFTTFSQLTINYMKDIHIIINTTPIGMAPQEEVSPINEDLFNESHIVFDIIYSPHNTVLLKNAEKKNCTIVHGINMLINQAIKQFDIWTNVKPPVEDLLNLVQKHLK